MSLTNKIILLFLGATIIPVIIIVSIIYPNLHDINDYFLVIIFAVLILSIFIGLWISKTLTDPIRNLSYIINEFSKNPQSSVRVPVQSRDDIGMLAKNFNAMADRISKSYVEINSANQQLKAGNQQLHASNQQLGASNQQLISTEKTLKEKLHELEVFNKVTIGRELKMIELKKEIEELQKQLKN